MIYMHFKTMIMAVSDHNGSGAHELHVPPREHLEQTIMQIPVPTKL